MSSYASDPWPWVLANRSWGGVLWFSQGIPRQGNTLLYQAGEVEQTVQTPGESLASQSRAQPMRPRRRLTPGFQGTPRLSGAHSFLFKKDNTAVLAFVRDQVERSVGISAMVLWDSLSTFGSQQSPSPAGPNLGISQVRGSECQEGFLPAASSFEALSVA